MNPVKVSHSSLLPVESIHTFAGKNGLQEPFGKLEVTTTTTNRFTLHCQSSKLSRVGSSGHFCLMILAAQLFHLFCTCRGTPRRATRNTLSMTVQAFCSGSSIFWPKGFSRSSLLELSRTVPLSFS